MRSLESSATVASPAVTVLAVIGALRRLGLIAALLLGVALGAPPAGQAQSPEDLCADVPPNVNCGPGNDRRTAGGGEKVPHNDGAGRSWPKISGILWQVVDNASRRMLAGPDNDELLGHHGSDHLAGAGGHDIIWGDWDPRNNSTRQRDYISGGSGNDWLYPSHGRSQVFGGPGQDYVYAFYGKGTIDCGPGRDVARIRTNGAFKTRNCETIKHFCAFGADASGNCLSPTGRPIVASRRTG
jgi:Ca2+-binding RTX toxin-like protein